VQGEFQCPAHRLDDAGRADLVPFRIAQDKLDIRALQERRKLQVDTYSLPLGIGFGAQAEDASLFRREALNLRVEEEGVH